MPKPPIQQAKENILRILRNAAPEVEEIVYPCLPQDMADYRSALDLVEVQQEFNRRKVKATLELYKETSPPQIVVATLDDIASGKLDEYMR
ncbi:hypothetical protein DSM106972_016110 [Dulcicalothrix desertica PCC 7102]|uniref:Uncharacterized protein n=1 Tax=Dulcicalothrix desertica PCC 7102 TaxID=232991 RepID=A0A3S1CSD0_9CYAN|nr:hypothetical protein [Dulcicalothrix desertica]RUT08443.1 hypothetical protein DSM106972_016110 [Dulcicalothrix desertica PCC 7102]TWH40307.1 hypothetical protein CAL7102_09615 [Dulcicalothrix desertica PCC 7102]